MKNFMLGFFCATTLSLSVFIAWEYVRHIPVVIKEVPIVKIVPSPPVPDGVKK